MSHYHRPIEATKLTREEIGAIIAGDCTAFIQVTIMVLYLIHEYLTNSRRGEFRKIEKWTRVGHRWCYIILKLLNMCICCSSRKKLESDVESARESLLEPEYQTSKIE